MISLNNKEYSFLLFKLNRILGRGIDGVVYSLINDTEKVIKISYIDKRYNFHYNENNFSYLLKNQITFLPKCFEFKKIKEDDIHVMYYCIMEKCFPISSDEYKVFHSLISHEDANKIKKNYKILTGLSRGLDFDENKVKLFVNLINNQNKIQHKDVHPRNIMKDILGNFKLVDLDRMEFNYE